MYDVIIIGAGVSGAAAARELSRYNVKTCVIEKEEDVCCGTSKANSAIVHAGYDAAEGSLMAKLNVRGNQMMEQLSRDLDFPFKQNGSLVVCLHEEDMPKLQTLYDRGVANGVKGLRILNREELKEMEPNISDEACAALYAPSAGIICPFNMNIAMAENAYANGVEFKFDMEVTNLKPIEEGWEVHTNNGVFQTKYIVNAAGVYADKFHNMVSEKKIHITPRRGDYCLLDKSAGDHVSRTIFALPGKYGKELMKDVEEILDAYLRMEERAAGLRTEEKTVRIGSVYPLAPRTIPQMLKEFRETFPFVIYNRLTPEIEEGLLDGKYDIGFCSELLKSDELEYYPIRESYVAAVVPKGHPLEKRAAVSLREVSCYPLVMFSRTSGFRKLQEQVFAEAGIEVRPVCSAEEIEVVAGLVENGFGITILPYMDIVRLHNIVTIPVETSSWKSKFYIARRKYGIRSDQEEAFFQYCRKNSSI